MFLCKFIAFFALLSLPSSFGIKKESKENVNDIDIRKKEDLERFVLSHIYYITQGNK